MPTPDGPYAEQRRIFDLLSQETRHLIIQFILGHPHHSMSLGELAYMIPKSKAAISDQLDRLIDEDILAAYHHEPSEDKRDLPATFYGPSERGVEILSDYKYLRGVPVIRALYRNTKKPENIQRHEAAPRPDLPEKVRKALEIDGDEPDESADSTAQRTVFRVAFEGGDPDALERELNSAADHATNALDGVASYSLTRLTGGTDGGN